MKKLSVFIIFICFLIPLFSQNKINHQKDDWYQLICVPIENERDPYTFEWIWRNTSWKDVIGFVEPKKMIDGRFKMSDFLFMNPSSRMGIELREALSIFEKNQLVEGGTHISGNVTYHIKSNGVVWQPDKTFLLMLVKLTVYPEYENDSGYEWW